ncbi:hypothetical protein LZC95_49385 [Pendulispora brunnea]|uniref:Uncharacterized protein n=1 Tax=Pendulispora brunnea TaxID=2905690 RepID=A0ABZ2KC37_9BACT
MSIFDKIKAWFGGKPAPVEPAPVEPAPARREKRRVTAKDDARLESEARGLFDAGQAAEGIALLSERGVLFARHEATTLPCLCRQCLRPELAAAEGAGIAYARDFVVTRNKVLFYWTPVELSDNAKQVRASMRAEVRHRLRVLASKEEETRQAINPFTKEPMTILPKHERRPRVNPFTGKPVP